MSSDAPQQRNDEVAGGPGVAQDFVEELDEEGPLSPEAAYRLGGAMLSRRV